MVVDVVAWSQNGDLPMTAAEVMSRCLRYEQPARFAIDARDMACFVLRCWNQQRVRIPSGTQRSMRRESLVVEIECI